MVTLKYIYYIYMNFPLASNWDKFLKYFQAHPFGSVSAICTQNIFRKKKNAKIKSHFFFYQILLFSRTFPCLKKTFKNVSYFRVFLDCGDPGSYIKMIVVKEQLK